LSDATNEGGPKTYAEGAEFTGVIGRTIADSVQAWPEPVRAPTAAPNVVVVLLDDVGFAQIRSFGADIRTPTFDRLAANGLRYRQFHTTALCTPSRACLLTGRNHHANASGRLSSAPLGFPGYHALIPKENGFLSEILRQHGYATFAIGKWHLTPYNELAAGSSHTRWPLGRGFDRFYGFMGGFTSQWSPSLVYDNHVVAPPRTADEGYHLNEDLADRAIEFVSDLRAADPSRPFFLYYCPGAGHFPHHVPKQWRDRYTGQFDQGWDRWRDAVFSRQLENGTVPRETTLSPRPEWIAGWDSLGAEKQRLYARQMEVYAGFLDHTDHHIGRLVSFLENIGELDNTVLIVTSDNGADGLSGEHGSYGMGRGLPGTHLEDDFDATFALIDEWGSRATYPNYSWGWAWAGNSPFRRWKRYLHEGGISGPFIVSWPRGFRARNEVRDQYAHITDIAPTVLDLLGIDPPAEVDGVAQTPLHGVSFAHTLDDSDAPTNKSIQYYEMTGSRAIWVRGWKAVTEQTYGVQLTEEALAAQRWELYCIDDDFSECHDVADQYPRKLRELIELWWVEAGRYGVLPLDAQLRAPDEPRPRSRYVYYPGAAPVPAAVAANVANRAYRITAHIEIPDEGAEGILVAHGGGFYGGYALYVQDLRLHFIHQCPGIREQRATSDIELPSGCLTAGVEFTMGEGGGTAVLKVDGTEVGRRDIIGPLHARYALCSVGLCCGYHAGEPVTVAYRPPFRFTGVIEQAVVEVDDSKPPASR
jgi:arylsulfatase A-like enzyme